MLFKKLRNFIIICLSGFILSLSTPGYDLGFFAWVGLVPLFVILIMPGKSKEVVFLSFLFGFIYNLSCLKWIISLHPLYWLGFNNVQSYLVSFIAYFITCAYNGLFFILFALIFLLVKKFGPFPFNQGIINKILLSLLWIVVFNKISASKCLLGFPWTLIEYSQYKNFYLIQISEYLGSQFISFLIVFFNLAVAEFVVYFLSVEKISGTYISKSPFQLTYLMGNILFAAGLITVTSLLGIQLYSNTIKSSRSLPSHYVCVVQGNLPIKSTRGGHIDKSLSKKTYEDLIRYCKSEIIIAPEGSLPTNFSNDTGIQSWLKENARKENADIIFGSYCKNNSDFTNCAVVYSPETKAFSYYNKEILVPFGEFTPFSPFLPELIKELTSFTLGYGFEEGKNTSLSYLRAGKAGINICFELIFPSIIQKHILSGANFLINLSDLSWFSDTLIRKQFVAFGVFRAIESRKPLIISSNDGISAFIDQTGIIKSFSAPKSRYILKDRIVPNNKKTFYAEYGW